MERVVIVGAGLYGLIAAKTYLQVTGALDEEQSTRSTTEATNELPACFTHLRCEPAKSVSERRLLVLDAASDLGGTWAEERLYPNLLSQNSYGLYEFSDLPLSDVVPEEDGTNQHFIAGWKINRYLHAWVDKWDLRKHIRLNWKVDSIARHESKEWELEVSVTASATRNMTVICDKLILATGLTSVPNLPAMKNFEGNTATTAPVIHAKHVGDWARDHLGYQPLLKRTPTKDGLYEKRLRAVAIYGGAKSSFDLMHFFATLHHNTPELHLACAPQEPLQVHWIIRDGGAGVSWMAPPTSSLPSGQTVASDKAASTRLLSYLSPCCYEIPKRLSLVPLPSGWGWSLRLEGSWFARIFHGNPLGRWWIRRFWRSVDQNLEDFAHYRSEPKMQKLRPDHSVVSCASSIGIANQHDLWETIRLPQVHVHRSAIAGISGRGARGTAEATADATVHLEDETQIDPVDLIVLATGYRPIVPVRFHPPNLRLGLGLSSLINGDSAETTWGSQEDIENFPERIYGPLAPAAKDRLDHWHALDQQSEAKVRKSLAATGCFPVGGAAPSWTGNLKLVPYRLFRRMVAPELVAAGDRSFAALGIVLTSTIAVVAEVQALWVTAFLTGGLDSGPGQSTLDEHGSLCLDSLSLEAMDESISEDVVLGALTGSGLEVDAIQYNDRLMRDLGLNPNRLGGGFFTELTGVYEPSAYAGIVDEYRTSRGLGVK